MKKQSRLTLIGLLFLLVFSCSEDEYLSHSSRGSVTNKFLITILAEENGNIAPTEAEAGIYLGEMLVSAHALTVTDNQVFFTGNPEETYQLKVVKRGYEPYTLSFKYGELRNALAGKPLQIKMKPAVELALTFFEEDGYAIDLQGSGTITIVWPDNSVETHTLPASLYREMEAGSGQIIITGDLKNISLFRAFGYNTRISKISGLKHLKGMETFYPGLLFLDEMLDLHQNRKLQQLDLFHATLPEWFRLPQQHDISAVTLSLADRVIATEEIDLLIDNIYRNAVRRGIYNGMLHLSNSARPSAGALDKIQILRNEYRWDVELNL